MIGKILVLTGMLLMAGCSSNFRMENVNAAFPDSEVAFVPGQQQDFLVRTPNGNIWYVRCDNPFKGEITSKSMVFAGVKK
jgi:hypothetical protein